MSDCSSIDAVQKTLAEQGYVCARPLATVVFLSLSLGRPLLLEGKRASAKPKSQKRLPQRWGGG